MASVSEGVVEEINCRRRQLTTTTAMVPGSLTARDGEVTSSVSSTTVIQTDGASRTTAW